MNRSQFEHILRACKGTTSETEFVVIGSQSVLGRFPDAPRVLRQSMEADVYPRHQPELAPLLTGNLGELSLFHQTHGYWVDGVSPTTAALPADWETRLVKVCNENTGGAVGWCLDPHDLAYSKRAARREKDLAFVAALLRHRMIRPSLVARLIADASDPPVRSRLAEAWEICRRRAADSDAPSSSRA